jgi:predicted transglutaminase-like cysteine proteinase
MQFFTKDGDCEDYAIAKYLTLRALGWKADTLRIVVLQDMNLRIAHAILSVYYKGKILLLDNQIAQVVDSRNVRHYQPIYSVNENGWWRLRRAR